MKGQRTVLAAVLGMLAPGMLALALVTVPRAAASPETDAGDAITASWTASGGVAGPLGAPDGGVYPVGAGFGQDFVHGKIFYTPATGARRVQGAILEKYEALGGPEGGDLGFPTIDEGPGRVGPDSRNVLFNAPDNPVIFWTPATGAHVVRGALNAAWDRLGGSTGPLGVPVEDEVYRGDVVTQKFSGGELSWDRQTTMFTTVPPELAASLADLTVPDDPSSQINMAWRAAGGRLGPLGAAAGPPYPIGADGLGQKFDGGEVFFSPGSGAHALTGQVLDKYQRVGGPKGDLGFPTSGEQQGGFGPNSRLAAFGAADQPVIFWTPDYGPVIVRGAMNAAWAKLGGAAGPLGAPMADQTESDSVVTQRFSGGVVSWDAQSNTFTTEPSQLAGSLAGLEVPGFRPPEAPQATEAPGAPQGNWLARHWSWWWLLALVPVGALAAVVVGAVTTNRRRSAADRRFDDFTDLNRPDGDPIHRPGDGSGYLEPAAPLVSATGPQRPPAAVGPQQGDAAVALEPDPDAVDTAPTRIEGTPGGFGNFVPAVTQSGAAESDAAESDAVAQSAQEAPAPRTAIHLPPPDPRQAPDGYPVKADTRSGLYWLPDCAGYETAVAEVWFASEELAEANGFTKAD